MRRGRCAKEKWNNCAGAPQRTGSASWGRLNCFTSRLIGFKRRREEQNSVEHALSVQAQASFGFSMHNNQLCGC